MSEVAFDPETHVQQPDEQNDPLTLARKAIGELTTARNSGVFDDVVIQGLRAALSAAELRSNGEAGLEIPQSAN